MVGVRKDNVWHHPHAAVAGDARHLRACVQIVTPNVDMTQDIECSSCGAVTEMEGPFTSEFFWPN